MTKNEPLIVTSQVLKKCFTQYRILMYNMPKTPRDWIKTDSTRCQTNFSDNSLVAMYTEN